MILQTIIQGRGGLLEFASGIGIGRVAVEVGVLRAEFSLEILDAFGGTLVGIDPFLPFWEAPGDRGVHLEEMVRNTKKVAGSQFFLKKEKNSHQLADKICREFGVPDFVYIDGDHLYEPCKLDIDIWRRVMSDGRTRILAGHDYTDRQPGVVKAVHEIANHSKVYLTHDVDWRSWFVVLGDKREKIEAEIPIAGGSL